MSSRAITPPTLDMACHSRGPAETCPDAQNRPLRRELANKAMARTGACWKAPIEADGQYSLVGPSPEATFQDCPDVTDHGLKVMVKEGGKGLRVGC